MPSTLGAELTAHFSSCALPHLLFLCSLGILRRCDATAPGLEIVDENTLFELILRPPSAPVDICTQGDARLYWTDTVIPSLQANSRWYAFHQQLGGRDRPPLAAAAVTVGEATSGERFTGESFGAAVGKISKHILWHLFRLWFCHLKTVCASHRTYCYGRCSFRYIIVR